MTGQALGLLRYVCYKTAVYTVSCLCNVEHDYLHCAKCVYYFIDGVRIHCHCVYVALAGQVSETSSNHKQKFLDSFKFTAIVMKG